MEDKLFSLNFYNMNSNNNGCTIYVGIFKDPVKECGEGGRCGESLI